MASAAAQAPVYICAKRSCCSTIAYTHAHTHAQILLDKQIALHPPLVRPAHHPPEGDAGPPPPREDGPPAEGDAGPPARGIGRAVPLADKRDGEHGMNAPITANNDAYYDHKHCDMQFDK